MNNTVELKCWTCERDFTTEYGPGRRRRYCSLDCKELARKVARRIRYVELAEQQRTAHVASH